jgi:Lrp/AsnC family leucine-responsive transcriptional regulator
LRSQPQKRLVLAFSATDNLIGHSLMPNLKLDAFDRKILEALQRDGRLSNVQLADEIGLSASPCLRRVRLLEEAGVIRGYQATLDRENVPID